MQSDYFLKLLSHLSAFKEKIIVTGDSLIVLSSEMNPKASVNLHIPVPSSCNSPSVTDGICPKPFVYHSF